LESSTFAEGGGRIGASIIKIESLLPGGSRVGAKARRWDKTKPEASEKVESRN